MKINNNTQKEFQPIELHLTIESKRELEFFCSILNANGYEMSDFVNKNRYNEMQEFSTAEVKEATRELWNFLDDELEKC